MSEYKMNLNGIHPGDEIKCSNGDKLLITTVKTGDQATANLLSREQQGNFKSLVNTIHHSEKNNNCWKFYA